MVATLLRRFSRRRLHDFRRVVQLGCGEYDEIDIEHVFLPVLARCQVN